LSIEPERGRQAEPVWTSKRSAAWVAEELHAVAPFDQRHAFGGEAFELDRADLRAVLLFLTLALRLFVVVELAFDPFERTVEEIDR
jgi:hypothetical protein